jgi:hypothetical protein
MRRAAIVVCRSVMLLRYRRTSLSALTAFVIGFAFCIGVAVSRLELACVHTVQVWMKGQASLFRLVSLYDFRSYIVFYVRSLQCNQPFLST